jgi:hypothetical protein
MGIGELPEGIAASPAGSAQFGKWVLSQSPKYKKYPSFRRDIFYMSG